MKKIIVNLIQSALASVFKSNHWEQPEPLVIHVERPAQASHGDLSCHVALALAKTCQVAPRTLAQMIVAALPSDPQVTEVTVAGPGFINFHLVKSYLHRGVIDTLSAGDQVGCSQLGQGKSVHLEYVSANPTGPLHVGHGRGAALGSCLAHILKATGYQVHQEYYVNDAGRQMHLLAVSVWVRYLQLLGEEVALPAKGYQGDYVQVIAQSLLADYGRQFWHTKSAIEAALPDSACPEQEDSYIDEWVKVAQSLLTKEQFQSVFSQGLDTILAGIKSDLGAFGVSFDGWFHESQLLGSGALEAGLLTLKKQGWTYEKQGALWFKATELGDEKDRVLVRENGQPTYFASDVAYHLHKFKQGYDYIIDIFGADHHGYTPRIQACLKGLDQDVSRLKTILVQFAVLYRGQEKVMMTTRGGDFVTLKALCEEVGCSPARFFYVMRKPEQHLAFDLALAKAQNNQNPVYYIQYAHARICRVWEQAKRKGWQIDHEQGVGSLALLTQTQEYRLMEQLGGFAETLERCALSFQPHYLVNFLQTMAADFHSYYAACTFLVDDTGLRQARFALLAACQCVLKKGLALLGVEAPETM